MKIEKTKHDSGLGIYATSVPIKTRSEWKAAKQVANEMIEWFDKANGSFVGEFERGFAMAHSQVAPVEKPLQLFVVANDLVNPNPPAKLPNGKENTLNIANKYWESQAIFNCEVLETPEKITRNDVMLRNIIKVPEGCMSFLHRKEKNVKRFYKIKVRFQYIASGLFGEKVKTFEGWVEGLKAHIIQHECDHFNAENIYF